MKKKIFTLFLVLSLCMGLMPMGVFATDGGSEAPFEIELTEASDRSPDPTLTGEKAPTLPQADSAQASDRSSDLTSTGEENPASPQADSAQASDRSSDLTLTGEENPVSPLSDSAQASDRSSDSEALPTPVSEENEENQEEDAPATTYTVKLRGSKPVESMKLIDSDGNEIWTAPSVRGTEVSLNKAGRYAYAGYTAKYSKDNPPDESTCIGRGYFDVFEEASTKAQEIRFHRYIYSVSFPLGFDAELDQFVNVPGRLKVTCENRDYTFAPGDENPPDRSYHLLISSGGNNDPTKVTLEYISDHDSLGCTPELIVAKGFTQTTSTGWLFFKVTATVKVPTTYENLYHLYVKPEKHYVPFTELEPVSKEAKDDGYTYFDYELTPSDSFFLHYTIDHDDALGNIKLSRRFSLTPRTIDNPVITIRGYSANKASYGTDIHNYDNPSKYPEAYKEYDLDNGLRMDLSPWMEDNLYLNVDDSNYISLDEIGDTKKIEAFRVWQAVNNCTGNYFIEPDFHYFVIGDSVKITQKGQEGREYATAEAVKEGVSVILVTYDAMYWSDSSSQSRTLAEQSLMEGSLDNICYYDAIEPINTRAIVVNVGGHNNANISANLARYDLDSLQGGGTEGDTIYFDKGITDHASYTFTPTADKGHTLSVRVHDPIYSESWWENSDWIADSVWTDEDKWKDFEIQEDGSCTIDLKDGRNIVEISAEDGSVVYYVINCRGIDIEIENLTRPDATNYRTGDTVSITLDGLSLPVQKMSGIYNPNFPDQGWIEYDTSTGQTVRSRGAQYVAVAKDVCKLKVKLTHPGDLLLSNGRIHCTSLGEGITAHRNISESGFAPNLNAQGSDYRAFFSTLPDITIPGITGESVIDDDELSLTMPSFVVNCGNNSTISQDLAERGQVMVSDTSMGFTSNELYDLYTVEIPKGTKTVDLTFTKYCRAYGYDDDKQTMTIGPEDYADGGKNIATRPVDLDGDGKMDYVFVQTAPNENGKSLIFYVITFKYKEGSDNENQNHQGSTGDTDSIAVTFRLIGSTKAQGMIDLSDGDYKGAEYVTWVKTTPYRFDGDEPVSVGDLFQKAMSDAGLGYSGLDKNYISSITAPSVCGGYDLPEMMNGRRSGWMYTVKGKDATGEGSHPNKGLNDWYLEDGDAVVWHYVNDYLYEVADWQGLGDYEAKGDKDTWNKWLDAPDVKPSSNSSGGGSSSSSLEDTSGQQTKPQSLIEIKPEATVTNSKASVTLTDKDMSSAIEKAAGDKNASVVITPDFKGEAKAITVALPKSSVEALGNKAKADLNVNTDIAKVKLSDEALSEIAEKKGETIVVSLEKAQDQVKVNIKAGETTIERLKAPMTVSVTADKTSDSSVAVLVSDSGEETIIRKSIVDGNTVSALVDGSCTLKVKSNAVAFTDTQGHWGESFIHFASSRKLFSGVGDNRFAPQGKMTRAMFATVLHHLEDDAAVTGNNTFSDVADGKWYTDAILWANEKGIVSGYGNNQFGTQNNITREQLAVMLYHYADMMKLDTTVKGNLSKFSDSNAISKYADDAMSWAVGSGILHGNSNGTINPKGEATRAEVAVMLQHLIKLMV